MGLRNLTFDDRDTTTLKYVGNWAHDGSWNASNLPDDPTGTLSSTNDPSANVTFTFTEPANAFYYYGMKRSNGGLYAICIDCDPNNPQFTPIDALDRSDNGRNAPVLLFSRTFNDFGVHEIILTNQNDTRTVPSGNSQITVDRFEIQIQDDSVSSSSSTSLSTSSTISSSSSAPSSTTTNSSSSSSTPIGAIAGGVIGGLALLAVCALIWLLIRRQNRRTYKADTEGSAHAAHPPNSGSSFGTPFNASTLPSSTVSSPNQSLPSFGYGVGGRKRQPTPSTEDAVTTSQTPTSASASTHSRSRSGVTSTTGSRRPRRERDAGRIMESESEYGDGETLPPDYDQVFRRGRSIRSSAALSPVRANNPDHSDASNTAGSEVTSSNSGSRRALPVIPERLKG